MNEIASEPLTKPKPLRYKRTQWRAMGFLAEANNGVSIVHVARVFADFGIKLCKMNGNQLPMIDQVRLQRALAHRAKRDSKRRK